MLHAVPELLDTLETRLLAGEDPTKLLAGIRWSELVGWPTDAAGALALKRRIGLLQNLLSGLQAPLRGTLLCLSAAPGYGRDGGPSDPQVFPIRTHGKV